MDFSMNILFDVIRWYIHSNIYTIHISVIQIYHRIKRDSLAAIYKRKFNKPQTIFEGFQWKIHFVLQLRYVILFHCTRFST